MVLNSDSYNSMGIKIHVLELEENSLDIRECVERTFNKNTEKQQDGAIRLNFQLKPLLISSVMHRALTTPKCALNSSKFFKNNVNVVKSFEYRLNPGNLINFKTVVNCGPGVRLDLLKQMLYLIGAQPSSYSVCIEAMGYDCEAIRLEDKYKFIGTAPGWLTIEYEKGFELCLQNNSISSSNLQDSLNSDEHDEYAIKIYKKRPPVAKPIDVNSDDIGTGSDKKFAIVSYSKVIERFAQDFSAPLESPKKEKININDLYSDDYDEFKEE